MRRTALLLAAALLLGGCSSDSEGEAAAPSTTPATPSAAKAAESDSWPPALPAGVPTSGEHAWRATWTPDLDAEQQFLADLSGTDDGDYRWGSGYVAANADRLVDFGYEICADYYRGVDGPSMTDHLQQPSSGLPGPTDVDRIMQAAEIELAARQRLCMNIDPWGDSY